MKTFRFRGVHCSLMSSGKWNDPFVAVQLYVAVTVSQYFYFMVAYTEYFYMHISILVLSLILVLILFGI